MELEEEILSDKINLAVLQFRAKNYGKCASIYAELVLNLLSLEDSRVIKIRRFHGLSDRPPYGKLVHPKLCAILDQRAATFEKLKALRSARQDAEQIITLDPINCKGYLRLGKLHLMANDKVAAYKIYQQGIYVIKKALEKNNFTVPERLWLQLQSLYKEVNGLLKQERAFTKSESELRVSSEADNLVGLLGLSKNPKNPKRTSRHTPNYSRGLQGQLDRMLPLKRAATEPMVPSKRHKPHLDIFEVFPREIIEAVFVNLSFKDVLGAHLVCKFWYDTLVSIPKLYRGNFTLKHRVTASEYLNGLKLMKKVLSFLYSKSLHLLSVWSTYNMQNLGKIIESVISDRSLKLARLHIIDKYLSMGFLLQKLDACKWNYSGLASVQHLRLGINSSLVSETLLFELFPNLQTLEILVVDQIPQKSNMLLLPIASKKYQQLVSTASTLKSQPFLKKLLLVNHPLLKRDHQSSRPGENTFDPRPPFMKLSFCALTELKVTSYDFAGLAVDLQEFLRETHFLTEIYLENNEELSLKKFLLLLALCSPSFRLKKLTLRESHQEGRYDIDEIVSDDLGCLNALSYLDIYGSSITSLGFLKLLTLANKDGHMKHINIGHSSYIQFKNDNFVSGNMVLRFAQVFQIAPGIESLYVPELSLDNLSMRLLQEDFSSFYGKLKNAPKLRNLDLSFCHLIDGIGLMNLFRSSSSSPELMKLDTLTLDGMHFKPETLQLLQKKGLVQKLLNDPFKKKWKLYGTNSFVLETD
ncbi:hypothetical protein METBIDRAFT_44733 [Metschnikowia bicuspidata var. bicuspidata NRRL YB-4993]|uniref:Uncharacterized protein n=1 Tax=Metschnikowia bicuspidata var. bicuspidata NRRL YB-4993 TaxID=869754 RepID=A0A1A0H700_9ASCO|nr:hypothetical protein METBIDRAFT_44733 [Metschnikowia bicuspidata var. bicuspidata NRRL YB-4993]OBA19811.1 hypothetical protein METBIDRAFT_44733 [Metschnikowia bicuspidata var. bicuspidata NRRL YB-4993]